LEVEREFGKCSKENGSARRRKTARIQTIYAASQAATIAAEEKY